MSLFISASGILAASAQQQVSANNIANLRTPGYRAARAGYEAQAGGGVRLEGQGRSDALGSIELTGRPLDLAAQTGFFQVETPEGETVYTRDGRFGLNADGEVVTQQGNRLIPPVQAPANATSVSVSESGVIYASTPAQLPPQAIGQMQVYTFNNPDGLEGLGSNLFRATPAAGSAQLMTAPALESGALNGSNVEVAREIADQIISSHMARANIEAFNMADEIMGELLDISE